MPLAAGRLLHSTGDKTCAIRRDLALANRSLAARGGCTRIYNCLMRTTKQHCLPSLATCGGATMNDFMRKLANSMLVGCAGLAVERVGVGDVRRVQNIVLYAERPSRLVVQSTSRPP
jgi:hypothetical protein